MQFEEAFMADFHNLDAERQDLVRLWFGWQQELATAAGLTLESWFELITSASNNPFDFSFVENFPDPEATAALEAENENENELRNALLAMESPQKRAIPSGEGVLTKARSAGLDGELYQRWFANAVEAGSGARRGTQAVRKPEKKAGPRGVRGAAPTK